MSESKQQIAERWMNFLTSEGYPCDLNGEGDVRFKCEGYTYFILIDANDPDYFRLIMPNIWAIEHESERARVHEAADHASGATKVAKIYTIGDNVWAAAEMLCASPEEAMPFFARLIRAVRGAAVVFAERARG